MEELLHGLRVYGRDKLRLAIAIAVLALGVGLGLAIALVNRAALDEFAAGLVALSGEADLTVRGSRSGFDESLLEQLGRLPEIAVASPVVTFEAEDGSGHRFTVTGIDAMRAALVERGLVGVPQQGETRGPGGGDAGADRLALLRPDS